MKIASCGGLVLDNVTITMVNNIITPVEEPPKTPQDYVISNCGGVKFNSEYFQNILGVITVREAQDAEITPIVIQQPGCGGLRVDSTYFKLDKNFGLSVDWDLIPDPPNQQPALKSVATKSKAAVQNIVTEPASEAATKKATTTRKSKKKATTTAAK